MDAETNIRARLPSRHVAEGSARAPHRSYDSTIVFAATDDVAEAFKKTPCIADSKPVSRYVAKDILQFGGIPLLRKTPLDHGHLQGDRMTVTGRTIAENLQSVTWNPNQDVVRPAAAEKVSHAHA